LAYEYKEPSFIDVFFILAACTAGLLGDLHKENMSLIVLNIGV
jgi:hypothetical protein